MNGKHGSIKKINSMLHPFAIDVICQGGTGFFFKQCRQIAAVKENSVEIAVRLKSAVRLKDI